MTQHLFVALLFVLCLIVIDFVTGLFGAFVTKSYDSTTMRKGLYHKAGEIFLIVLALVIDWGTKYIDIGVDIKLIIPCLVYIALMEIGSILENLYKIDSKIVPPFMHDYFIKMSEKDGEDDDK